MFESEKIDQVIPAIFAARSKFVKVKKDKQNTHLKNKYATLDSVLDAITPALTDNGLMIEQGMTPESNADSITVKTTVRHISGQYVAYLTTIPVAKKDPQGVGSAFTYARRYGLAAAFGLSQADDDAQLAVKSAQDWKKELSRCDSIESLQEVFKEAYKSSDAANRVIIKEHYDKVKSSIEIGNARGFVPSKPKENLNKGVDVKSDEVYNQPIENFE